MNGNRWLNEEHPYGAIAPEPGGLYREPGGPSSHLFSTQTWGKHELCLLLFPNRPDAWKTAICIARFELCLDPISDSEIMVWCGRVPTGNIDTLLFESTWAGCYLGDSLWLLSLGLHPESLFFGSGLQSKCPQRATKTFHSHAVGKACLSHCAVPLQ